MQNKHAYSRYIVRWTVCLALLIVGSINIWGQEVTAALGGKVTDPSGAVVQKAIVAVTSDATGVTRSTSTNSNGEWRVESLNAGAYRFEVSAAGFSKLSHSSVELQIGDRKFVDVQLQIGLQTETVSVEATTPLIDTTAAVSGGVLTTKDFEELPSKSNVPTLMAGLVPGVTVGGATGASVGHLWSNASDSNIMANAAGSGTRATNYTLDGGTDTSESGQVAFVPPMDSIAEIRVITNAYDASIGRQSGATINMASKTGTKALHGTLYEMNQNNTLNAKNSLAQGSNGVPSAIHYNEYGGVVGGPVWIPKLYNGVNKKTFFFFSWDGIKNKAPGSTGNMSIPTSLEKQGDFSKSFTTQTVSGVTTKYPVQIYDPTSIASTKSRSLLNGTGTAIPSGRINKPAQAYLKLLPDPENDGDGSSTDSNNYVKNEVQDDKFVTTSVRIDQTWNNSHSSSLSLRRNNWSEMSYDPFGPNNLLQGILQKRLNYGMTADHTWVIRPTLVANLKMDITHWEGSSINPSAGVSPTTLGISASSPYITMQQLPSLPYVTGIVSGAENGGLGTNQAGSYTNDTNQDYVVGMNQMLGSHNFRYGFEFLLQQEGSGGLGQQGGSFAFNSTWTSQNPDATACQGCGNSIASMLLGLPDSGSIPYNATAFWSQHYMALYFQDDWRMTKRLTLNLGFRWDIERPAYERFNRTWTRWDPTVVQTEVNAVAQPAYAALVGGSSANNTGLAYLQQYRGDASTFVTTGGITYAGVNGVPRSFQNTQYKYIQPRVGFAYEIQPNLVIRGGIGRFVQASFPTGSQDGFSASTPFKSTNDDYLTISSTFDNPYPSGRTVLPTGNTLGTRTNVGSYGGYTDPNYGRAYNDEASAYIQKQVKDWLIEIGGTFNLTHGLSVTDPRNSNKAGFNTNLPSAQAWIAANTPTFSSTGEPSATLPGNVKVPNPFYGAPYITNGTQTSKTIAAYQLSRPNPVVGDFLVDRSKGKTRYYSLNTKIDRRFHNGFSFLQSFTFSKRIQENTFIGPQALGARIDKELDTADQRFHYVVSPVYELPFGQGKRFGANVGKGFNEVIGGWEIAGTYQFQSGTPLLMPTKGSNFYKGGNPSLGSAKTKKHWFDTSLFAPYPTSSTTVTQLATLWPSWTGVTNLPGASYNPTLINGKAADGINNGVYMDFGTAYSYNQTTFGNLRNPYTTNLDLGLRKYFPLAGKTKIELRMDAFNALNHKSFGNIDTTPGDTYFGYVNGSATAVNETNAPRAVQLEGKLYF
ncbi:MAG: carboxypeptidase-like regulatory domain-containing protein [Terracidiphilus sp.]|nr:carboxypeptidase-like regulatory domain-containing protein [Terracidiphilus sp.]